MRVARHAGVAIAIATALAMVACAGTGTPRPDCPVASDVTNLQIIGTWQAELPEEGRTATVRIGLHPRLADSFAGTIERDGESNRMVGDVSSGDFTMEETRDGVRIFAAWVGDVVDGSCGREVRGTRQPTQGEPTPFVLTKQ